MLAIIHLFITLQINKNSLINFFFLGDANIKMTALSLLDSSPPFDNWYIYPFQFSSI